MCLLTIYFVIEKKFSIDGKIDWYGPYRAWMKEFFS